MIQTLSNLTIIIYAIAVMTMLLDTTPARLSRNKLSLLWAGAGIIALLQFFAGVAFRAKCKIFSRHLQKPILKTEKGRFKGL